MSRIGQAVDAIREDRRSNYLFPTKTASEAVGCHPNKFHDWWYRNRDKLIELGAVHPGELAAELAAIVALAIDLRERRAVKPPLHIRNHGEK